MSDRQQVLWETSRPHSHVTVLTCWFLLRHAGVLEISVLSFCGKRCGGDGGDGGDGDYAVYLSHDLSMLRLIETFSESAPQLVLMLTIMLQGDEVEPATGAARSRSRS